MDIVPCEFGKKREAEQDLLAEMLRREQNLHTGAKTFSTDNLADLTADILRQTKGS